MSVCGKTWSSIFTLIFCACVEREKSVQTVLLLLILSPQSMAYLDTLLTVSLSCRFAVVTYSQLLHMAKSSACRVFLTFGPVADTISLMKMRKKCWRDCTALWYSFLEVDFSAVHSIHLHPSCVILQEALDPFVHVPCYATLDQKISRCPGSERFIHPSQNVNTFSFRPRR